MKTTAKIGLAILLSFHSILISGQDSQYKAKPDRLVQEQRVYICISPTAYAYHKYECKGLARCTHEIKSVTVEKAQQSGYKPCHYCYGN